MANSRIMLTCKHCGESLCIGKGYFGGYCTVNEKIHEHLNEFYNKHYQGECSDDIDVSDNARNHFVILEEGESLKDLVPTADVVPKSEVESKYGYIHTYTGGHPDPVGDPGVMGWTGCTGCAKNHEVAKIFKEILTIIRSYEFDALVAKENYGIIQVRNFGTDILKLKKKYTGEKDDG